MQEVELIAVSKGGEYIEVHPSALADHIGRGWAACLKAEAPKAEAKPSDGLKVEEIKTALAEKGVEIPEGVTLKADLAALLDAS